MRIDVQHLDAFNVENDGKSVTLRAVDAQGMPVDLNFPIDQLGMLAMTFPNLIDAAVRRQYGDASCRFSYPLGSWVIEQTVDPSLVIVTLKTMDGFGISFSVRRSKARELSESMAFALAKKPEAITH
ncbi:MAG: hypothetical protein QM780_08080 [Hyphomicrobium sp.]|uniref:hypothetical protein n=1 Tax=Hyphomicrobium sp. TaxID=82 RepID=UPI0039E57642